MTDIGVQVEMMKEISAQDWMWYISNDKNKRKTFALTECEYKGGAAIRFDGRMIYSGKGTGGVGVLALSRGWRNGADIRPCVDHKTALGLLVDDEEDTADGEDARQGCRDYSLAGRFPSQEQGCWHFLA